ncbi:flavin-containing monooxygenase [Glacieibacterium frigidum]|uniref:NAD(P)/FAD-dependent oxidoreductase n=1 Tax=Glacieibacterium frigidum TaxID=2593303 RepID=A0A552U8X2_9SPHN|nr:NAD(P)/FAD-dependent oxidoreductase [Glacieibacterium frigidum]TRW14662.1 NAD(P)/FAD-dependent oxidoreductase [Glacieibacterium frigidum]
MTFTDAELRAALRDAHVPALLAALVHFAGSAEHLAGFQPPVADMTSIGDEQGGIPLDQQARARDLAFGLVTRWRDAGCPPLLRPSPEAVRAAMTYVAGSEIPAAYEAFLTDELHLDGLPGASRVTIERAAGDFSVVIVGAGMSGLLMGVACKQAGVPFTTIEARGEVGGTWTANRYPGCRVDTPNHLYSYSFEPAHEWPYRFSTAPVLQGYFARVAEKHGLMPHIRFGTRVESAAWDGEAWQVTLSGGETLRARAVVSAVGQLNRPKMPDLPGVGSFAGPAFHSAEWPEGVDLKAKRVAVIGTGASAFQIVPEIAGEVGSLSIFQRTPPWLLPQPFYHDAVAAGKNWLLEHLPFYANWYRFALFWSLTEFLLPAVAAEDGWEAPGSISPANAELRGFLEMALAAQYEDRPDLLAKLVPAYAPGGKRMLVDNGVWAAALKRPNVELVTEGVAGIEPAGVRLANGRLVEADVLIYATGFHASEFLMPMRVTGEGGADLHDAWGGDARAYLGMTVPGFPNFFMLYGPNTNIVVNGSIVFFSEASVNYIMGCLKLLIDGGRTALSPKRDVHDAFNLKVDSANATMAWGVDGVSSWYKSASGRVAQNWPFSLVEYWNATRAPRAEEFEVR